MKLRNHNKFQRSDPGSRIVHPEANLVFDHSKPDGTPQKLLNIDKLVGQGWKPEISFAEGIKNTYEWYLEQTRSLD